jgi:hypothetical protein
MATSLFEGITNLKLPVALVVVFLFLFRISTTAPFRGLPSSSITEPLIVAVLFCDNENKGNNKHTIKNLIS